jgi:hypothetical protein
LRSMIGEIATLPDGGGFCAYYACFRTQTDLE